MPQQEVANGKGQIEFFLAKPDHIIQFGGKKSFALMTFRHLSHTDIYFPAAL